MSAGHGLSEYPGRGEVVVNSSIGELDKFHAAIEHVQEPPFQLTPWASRRQDQDARRRFPNEFTWMQKESHPTTDGRDVDP